MDERAPDMRGLCPNGQGALAGMRAMAESAAMYNNRMHAIILANHPAPFPPALLPWKGKSVINFVLDEVLLQKQVSDITIVILPAYETLFKRHLTNSYPNHTIHLVTCVPAPQDEYMVLDGATHTSLRLQDFIRYYQQFKTVTYAAYDKTYPHPIPFTIFPRQSLRGTTVTHTYNCGTGFCTSTYAPLSNA